MKKPTFTDLSQPNPMPARLPAALDSMTALQQATKKKPKKTAAELVLVSFRCTDKERRSMRLTAIELGVSVQALILASVDAYRRSQGLRGQ